MTKINKKAYEKLIYEDLCALSGMPKSPERDHIEAVLRESVTYKYPPSAIAGRMLRSYDEFTFSSNREAMPIKLALEDAGFLAMDIPAPRVISGSGRSATDFVVHFLLREICSSYE